MESIALQTKQELDVFVNPQRQNIMRCMRIAGEAHDAQTDLRPNRHLAVLGAAPYPTAAVHRGDRAGSDTESIHGITARYYQLVAQTHKRRHGREDGYRSSAWR